MAERTLKKLKPPHLPVVILRPSIIVAAHKEPLPGWTDTLSAAGALGVAGAIGIVNYIHGHGDNVSDCVPVDLVSNSIIVSTALCAYKPGLTVVHSSTSHSNPMTWEQFMRFSWDFLRH
jgi:fatty acyl-CoA reductase